MVRGLRPVRVLAFRGMEAEKLSAREEELVIEEADAWFEYLEATQAQARTMRYAEIEPWAWARLNQRLRAVEHKRETLKAAAI
jgi:hypothetical protein